MIAVLLVLHFVIFLYLIVLLARFVADWIQALSPQWTPRGFLLVILEAVYTVTDPPLQFLRRFIPPLRLGGVSLDLSFMVLLLLLSILLNATNVSYA